VAARARLGGAETRAAPLDAEALDVLASYGWPGNVRELRNVLERAAILAQGGAIDAALLRDVLEIKLPPRPVPAGAELNLRWNLDRLERDLVLRAIAKTRGRKREACDLLGIDARNLGYYLRKHRIRDEEVRQAAEG
jgi:Nif-specific regulatory protein